MLIPVPAHLLVQQDLDGAVWAACNHLSQLGINNFFHHAGDRRVTINGRYYSVVIDMVNTGVLFTQRRQNAHHQRTAQNMERLPTRI